MEYNAPVIPLGLIVAFFFVIFIIIAAQWRIYEKTGQPGWASLVPIYNIYVLTKICGKPRIWTLYMFIPILNLVLAIWLVNMLSKSFGKEEGFTAGLIFLGIFFYPILGFGPAKYLGTYGDSAAFAAWQGKDKFDFEQPQQ